MKILHISDTHGCHRRLHDLPQADIVVHSGDFTMNGSEQVGFHELVMRPSLSAKDIHLRQPR